MEMCTACVCEMGRNAPNYSMVQSEGAGELPGGKFSGSEGRDHSRDLVQLEFRLPLSSLYPWLVVGIDVPKLGGKSYCPLEQSDQGSQAGRL